jgi:hypothetical protein
MEPTKRQAALSKHGLADFEEQLKRTILANCYFVEQ